MSFQARAARALLRVTTRLPLSRALGTPRVVAATRSAFNRGGLTFGRASRRVRIESIDVDGMRGEWTIPRARPTQRVIYYLHGGGFVACAVATYRTLTSALALHANASVCAVDYRLAPEHPFPAAHDDALRGYRWLLAQGIAPEQIVIAGDSAGGNLALATAIAARDRGEPLPAALVLFSPWTDLAGTGASARENAATDDLIVDDGSHAVARAYAGDRDLDDPAISPLYADLDGLAPMLVHASSIEILRDDAIRLVERVRERGGDARIRLWDGVPHVWQLFASLPESRASFEEAGRFVTACCDRGPVSVSA